MRRRPLPPGRSGRFKAFHRDARASSAAGAPDGDSVGLRATLRASRGSGRPTRLPRRPDAKGSPTGRRQTAPRGGPRMYQRTGLRGARTTPSTHHLHRRGARRRHAGRTAWRYHRRGSGGGSADADRDGRTGRRHQARGALRGRLRRLFRVRPGRRGPAPAGGGGRPRNRLEGDAAARRGPAVGARRRARDHAARGQGPGRGRGARERGTPDLPVLERDPRQHRCGAAVNGRGVETSSKAVAT